MLLHMCSLVISLFSCDLIKMEIDQIRNLHQTLFTQCMVFTNINGRASILFKFNPNSFLIVSSHLLTFIFIYVRSCC